MFEFDQLNQGGGKRKKNTRRRTAKTGKKLKHVGKKNKSRSRSRSGGFDSGVLVPAALLGALQLYKRRSSNKSSKKMSRRRRK